MKKVLSAVLAVLLLVTAFPLAVSADDGGIVVDVITEDGDYVIECDENNPVDIDGVTGTVTLNNASIQNTGRSAIVVKGNSDITFILEGYSTIKGDANVKSCGIEVQYGSKVTFTGEGTLNVTGGNLGAGIGSWGYERNSAESKNTVGEIVIESGNIIAYGGYYGAGIGSGAHSSGNSIIINGGVIHAYGGTLGTGIGSGYGTSGGAIGVKAVGEYESGSIIINGGEIYAASYPNADFSLCDISRLSSLEDIIDGDDKGGFGVGIGGGYGASATDIQINGGKVCAISRSGGAAIGTGRGCSNAAKYNADAYVCNIKIGGNADVTAITSDFRKDGDHRGGAAIGTGRGTHTGGNIEITGNAKVTAINASLSPAIGASKQPAPGNGPVPVPESLVIGDNVDLYAVSAASYAVDKDAANLSINDQYFGSSDRWFFHEGAVAISDVQNVKAESTKGEKMYTAPAGSVSLWSRIVPPTDPTNPEEPDTPVQKVSMGIVTPLAMAVRFEDGSVYYSGDTVEVEVGKDYHFQMCCVDWSTRDANSEKKIHRPYEVFTPQHGVYSDEGIGLAGTVVYTVRVSNRNDERSYDEATKTFVLPFGDKVLRTDVNKCFMAYRFHFKSGDYHKQTGIDKVVYDTGIDHENTIEDFRYNKPLESLSVNLPLGSTITAKVYKNYEYIGEDNILITIDEEHPDRCYKDYIWDY